MRRYLILFLFLSVLNCTKRYTRISEDQLTSVDERTVTFYMNPVSMPSIDSPYIVIQTKEIVRIFEVYEHQAKERKLHGSAFVSLIGVIPGAFLMSWGYVVLGRDIIGCSLFSQAIIFKSLISEPDKIKWRYESDKYFEERIPVGEKFMLSLVDENFSNNYLPDNEGLLKIDIKDFSPFYKKGQDFEFKLISPKGDTIDLLVATDEISLLLLNVEMNNE